MVVVVEFVEVKSLLGGEHRYTPRGTTRKTGGRPKAVFELKDRRQKFGDLGRFVILKGPWR